MKKKIIGLIGLLFGLAIYWWVSGGQEKSSGEFDDRLGQPLQAIRLSPQEVTTYEELPGRITAQQVAEIRPQVTGIITKRLFKEGSAVKEGQQLYQIDPLPYQAAYDRAMANLQKAQANAQSIKARSLRYKELVKIDAVSKQEHEDIQAQLLQANADIAIAKAALVQAKVNLNYTKVYAPISGRIGKSKVTKGALVTAGQASTLATIVSLSPIYVDMSQSSNRLMKLREVIKDYKNVPVTLFIGEGQIPYAQAGKVKFHEVTVEPTTDSVQLRALFPNPDRVLLPGLFVRARLALRQPNALLVPQHAATRQPDGQLSVWKLDEKSAAQPASIVASGAIEGNWIVSEGLRPGDVIITEGLMQLRPGAKIAPVFTAEEGASTDIESADTESADSESKAGE